MDNMLFLSEKDTNSSILYEWFMNTMPEEIINSTNILSIHKSKNETREYGIQRVPSLYTNGKILQGQEIVIFFESFLEKNTEAKQEETREESGEVSVENAMKVMEDKRRELEDMLNRKN